MNILLKSSLVLLALALVAIVFFYSHSFLSRLHPRPVGLTAEGRLLPCPATPNCVSSQAPDAGDRRHQTRPIRYLGSREETQRRLAAVLDATPRLRWIERDDRYWHLTATTLLLRYVDELEFVFDGEARLVHVRSASRIGTWDFGANRKRVRAIRTALERGAGAQP
jgi:uncharacterized protein (DUF1499 family)